MNKKEELLLQLQSQGIEDKRVIEAIAEVPREKFISSTLQEYAYEDIPQPIGYSQTISSPFIVAYMLQAANLAKESKVLEIGTGSGYQTAVLSLLCDKVYSIEIIPELAESAEKLLKKLGYYHNKNIDIQIGSGYETKFKDNSFDAILVTASPPFIPEHLKNLLKVGGRLIIPVEDYLHQQKLLRIMRHSKNKFSEEFLLDVRFVPMVQG